MVLIFEKLQPTDILSSGITYRIRKKMTLLFCGRSTVRQLEPRVVRLRNLVLIK